MPDRAANTPSEPSPGGKGFWDRLKRQVERLGNLQAADTEKAETVHEAALKEGAPTRPIQDTVQHEEGGGLGGEAAAINSALPTSEGLAGGAALGAPSSAKGGAAAAPTEDSGSDLNAAQRSDLGATAVPSAGRGSAGGGGAGASTPSGQASGQASPLTVKGAQQGFTIEDVALKATGQLVASGGVQPSFMAQTLIGRYGDLTIKNDGSWFYQLDPKRSQELNNGDTVQESFGVLAGDRTGQSLPAMVTLTVKGTDDAAVITGVKTGSITEDLGPQVSSGVLLATDIDRGDQPTFVPQTVNGSYGSFSLQVDGHWSYSADPQKIQALKDGQQVVETFPISTTNAQGEVVKGSVSITVTGTDDQSVLPAVSLTATEDGGVVTGRLVATDVDATALHYEPVPGSAPVPGVTIAPDGTVRVDPAQPEFQSLAVGEHRDLQVPVQVVDERGVAVQSVVSVRIDGSNDAPTVTVRPPVPMDEGSGVHSVQVLARDVDSSDQLSYGSPAGMPLPGGVSLDTATGLVSIDTNHPAYNHLAVGEVQTVVVPVVVSDGHGGSTTTQVSLELHGTNDAPVLAAIGQRTATEGDAPINGQLSASDPDTTDKLSYGLPSGLSAPAGFTIQPDGHWSFDPQNPAYTSLRAGDHQQVVIPLEVSDGHGGTSRQSLNLDLVGSNDRAQIAGTSTGSVKEDQRLQAAGVLSITDPDAGEAHFQSGDQIGTYGVLHVQADGSWTYDLDNSNPKVQALPAGGSLTDHLLVLSADGTVNQINIAVAGTDDVAQVSGSHAGQVTEDRITSASGQLMVADSDQGETPQFQGETLQGVYGQLRIDASGHWSYQLDPATSQELQGGVKARETFTVLASDGKGHQLSQQVLVDVAGSNDAARISGTATGQLTEDTLTHASGKLDVVDVDRGEAHFQSGDQSGIYGTFHLDADGNWSYALDNINPKVQAMPAGTSATEMFTVRSADGTTHQVSVRIGGNNDAARISGSSSAQVREDSQPTANGKLDVSDVDTGEAHFQAGDQSGVYGTLHLDDDGQWRYDLDNNNPKVQALKAGTSVTETFTVHSADGTTHQVNVQVGGSNDAPTISGSSSGSVTEDGINQASGQLQIVDADQGESALDPSDVGDKVGTYGTLHVNADGSWSYLLNNNARVVQDLQAGDIRQDSFTVHSADGTSHQLQMTVTGASDAPVLTAGQISGGKEDTSLVLTSDQILKALQASDPDGDSLSVTGVSYSGSDATLVDNHDGTWTLTPHANWSGNLNFQVGVSDGHGTTTGSLTVPIAAVADKASMTVAPSLSSTFEDPTLGSQAYHFADPLQWGWHTDNVSGLVEQGKGETYGDPNHANTGLIELEGQAGEKDNLYRVLDTQPGAAYHFSLDVSGRVGADSDSAAVEVLWEGKVIDTIRPAANTFGFVRHEYDLTAHTDHPRIEFRAVTHDGGGPIVDNPHFEFRGFNGIEDTPLPIKLSVETVDKDGSETTSAGIKGLPTGFVISDGTPGHRLTSSDQTQALDMQGWDLQHLQVLPTANFHGRVDAVLIATTTETSNHDQSSTEIPVPLNFAGVNDPPTVQIGSGPALTEGSTASSTEQITGSDLDGDATSIDANWLTANHWSSSDGGLTYTKAGTYGTATLTMATKQVSYQLDNVAGNATDRLAAGATGRDAFEVQISDGHGGTASGTAIFNVTGADDGPTATAGSSAPLKEGSSGTATSILTMRDPDSTDPAPTIDTAWLTANGWSSSDGGQNYTKTGTYGSASLLMATGTVSYQLDNTAGGATDRLKEGIIGQDAFNVQVKDHLGHTAIASPTFSVIGSNDAPVVHAGAIGGGQEDSSIVLTGTDILNALHASDPDGNSLSVASVSYGGTDATLVHNSNGTWTLTPHANWKGDLDLQVGVSDGTTTTTQALGVHVSSVTDPAQASLSVTTAAEVMHFSANGQHAFKETGAGALSAFSLEVMAVGDPNNKGATDSSTGQVLFNMAAPGNNNILSLWRPAALSIAFGGSDHPTNPPLDLTTGQHRLTLTWDKTSGVLTLYDNGIERQHWDNVNKGQDLPAGTIVTVGQKMNDPAAKGGFNNNEQFHGDLFSVTMASQKVGAGDVAVPLANHLPKSSLLLDLREHNGAITDTAVTGAGSALSTSTPSIGTATQQVSTTASAPPEGAQLNLNVSITPPADTSDHISRELLRGLPPGTVLTDSTGTQRFTVPANGEVNVLTDLSGWQHLDQLKAQLPSGYKQNLPLQLLVETSDTGGAVKQTSSDASVLFDPTAGMSSLPPLTAPAPAPPPPPPAPGSQQSQELQDLLHQLQGAGVDVSETQAPITQYLHDPITSTPIEVLELHTAHGIVAQTLMISHDGSQQVVLDTSRLDATAQAALPAHPSASTTSQPLTSLDQPADDPDQPASSVNVMDQSLVAPALHLDPLALQDAVRTVGVSPNAPLDSVLSGDASNSEGGNSLPTTDQQSADLNPDLLAHAVQELSTSPVGSSATNGDGSGNGQDLGGHSVPVSTDPDPFAAATSAPMDADADNTATPLSPVEPPQDQNLDHLLTL